MFRRTFGDYQKNSNGGMFIRCGGTPAGSSKTRHCLAQVRIDAVQQLIQLTFIFLPVA
jgi:hypothetical protein